MPFPRLAILLALALVATTLNALKPVQGDDHTYLTYACEFSYHPSAPYAFRYKAPPGETEAMSVLVPPVLPYWLSVAVTCGGENPIWLRLWMLPFVALFTFSLHSLAERAACPFPTILTGTVLFSPAFLPGINCMLDLPALSLALAAVAVQWRAGEVRSIPLALLSGLLAGLAMQTKYTTFACVPLLACAGLLHGRWFVGIGSAVLATALFIGWEVHLWAACGQSHFLVAFGARSGSVINRIVHLVGPAVSQIGGPGAGFASLVFLALGRPRLGFLTLALAGTTPVILGVLPVGWIVWVAGAQPGQIGFGLPHLMHAITGLLVIKAVVVGVWALLRHREGEVEVFLAVWLLLELSMAFLLSPFPATRRFMGVLLVLALIAGRLASRCPTTPRMWSFQVASVAATALGLVYLAVDWADAAALRDAARHACRRAGEIAGPGRAWSFSWIGFQYYAEQDGARPLLINGPSPAPGDIVLVSEHELARGPNPALPPGLVLAETLHCPEPVLRLGFGYYAGRLPLSRRHGPPTRTLLYRVSKEVRSP